MNTSGTAEHAERDATSPARAIASRISSMPMPSSPRWSPMPIWCCRTRHISSARIASRCSTGRSAGRWPRAMRSASRWWQPDRDVRPFQDVLIDLGARLGLPGFVELDGKPKYPGLYADYIVNHERKPGIGMLAGWRGADGSKHGSGAPNPEPARALHREWLLLAARAAREPGLLPPCQQGLSGMGGRRWASSISPSPSCCRSTASRCRNSASPRAGPWRDAAARARPRAHRDLFRSAAVLVSAVRAGRGDGGRGISPLRHHPAADGHVSLLGLAECLAAPDLRRTIVST